MSSRLDRTDWERLAKECKYQISEMAKKMHVSVRQLCRYFEQATGIKLKPWVDERRLRSALDQIHRGASIKSAALAHGFKHSSNFTRFCERVSGELPSNHKK